MKWTKEYKRKYNKEYYRKNKKRMLARGKEWKKNNPEKMKSYRKKWNDNNKEYYRNYYSGYSVDSDYYKTHHWKEYHKNYFKKYQNKNNYREKRRGYMKAWEERNPGYRSRYLMKKYKTDLMFHIGENMRINIYKALRGKTKTGRWKRMVGYNIRELKEHLENQFDENMSWDNYGSYWHIDHIIPKTWFLFKSSNDIGFKMCWDIDNLQPLERIANIKKSNRYIYC